MPSLLPPLVSAGNLYLRRGSSRLADFCATSTSSRQSSTVPPPSSNTASVNQTRIEISQDISTIKEVVGESGCRYSIQKTLQHKETLVRGVYLTWYELIGIGCHEYLEAEMRPQC